MMENLNQEKQKVIEIYPVKVGRRVLAFLAEIFVCLILSIILFELCVFQISRLIVGYDKLVEDSETYQKGQYNILYQHELLYFDETSGEENRYMISLALEDTNYYFVNFYSNPNNEELRKYDVFYKYFVELKDTEDGEALDNLNDSYLHYGSEYFDSTKTTILGTYALKDEYQEAFSHNYLPGDSLSEDAQTQYEDFTKRVFLNLYNDLINDIKENDLKSLDNSFSYNQYNSEVESINHILNLNYIVCSYISFLFACIILFLVIPLITHKRETFVEIILKFERIDRKTLGYINKPIVLNIFLLKLMDCLTIVFLVPSLRVGFNYIFSFPELYLPSLIGVIIALANLAITICTKLNTSLKEITTNSIVIDSKSLDNYYQEVEVFNGK